MNKVIHLSLSRKSVPVIMDVVQGATAPAIDFVLDDYTPPGNARARLYIKKDGGEVYNDCTLSGNIATYTPTAGSFDVAGQCVAQLQITQGNTIAVSWRIFVTVEPNLIDGSAAPASTQYGALETLINNAQRYDSIIGSNNLTGANNRQGWIALTSGQDLNTVVTPNIYACGTTAIANSLLNVPTNPPLNGGFKMIVESISGASQGFRQTIIQPNNNTIGGINVVERTYKRQTENGGSTWTNWVFEPTRAELNSIANKSAKNLLVNNVSSQTLNGITITRNSDGSLTLNGTSTVSVLTTVPLGNIELTAGIYTLSGSTGGSSSTYRINLYGGTATSPVKLQSIDGSQTGTLEAGTYNARVLFNAGATLNNVTFYPMLRDASIQDDTYVPYGMSNAELTVKHGTLTLEEGVTLSSARVWQQGSTVFVQAYIVFTEIPSAITTIATITGVGMPNMQARFPVAMQDNLYSEPKEWGYGTITPAGLLQFKGAGLTKKNAYINMWYLV